MRLIVDANIMLSAMIKDSGVRKIIISGAHELFIPEYALQETLMYIDLISKKNKMSRGQNGQLLSVLLNYMNLVKPSLYTGKLKEALQIMKKIDEKDTPYAALALSIDNDGLWTADKDFDKQNKIKVWKTKDLL